MSLATTDEEVKKVIADAEAIRAGNGSTGGNPPSPAPGDTDAGAQASASATEPAPPADPGPMADLAVVLTDQAFRLLFGPGADMQGAIRDEAVKAWGAVIVKYAPMVQQAGPGGALLAVYAAHGMACYGQAWINAQSRASSESAEAGKQPS